jgi:hypothetical protein
MIEVEYKKCSQCKTRKSAKAFSKSKRTKDGMNSLCRLCVQENYRARYQSRYTKERNQYPVHRKQVKRPKSGDTVVTKVWDFENERIVEVKNEQSNGTN